MCTASRRPWRGSERRSRARRRPGSGTEHTAHELRGPAISENAGADIHRFGKLAVYDTACRLGVYLGLGPEVVYLHAGTTKGAKALSLDTNRGYLEIEGAGSFLRIDL